MCTDLKSPSLCSGCACVCVTAEGGGEGIPTVTKCLGQSSSHVEQPEQTKGSGAALGSSLPAQLPGLQPEFCLPAPATSALPEAGKYLALRSERATSCGDTENCSLLLSAMGVFAER